MLRHAQRVISAPMVQWLRPQTLNLVSSVRNNLTNVRVGAEQSKIIFQQYISEDECIHTWIVSLLGLHQLIRPRFTLAYNEMIVDIWV